MQVSLFGVILIALAAMFFGYFFGLFEGRSQGEKKRAADGKDEKRAGDEKSAAAAPVIRDDPGLLRLKDDYGQIRVELDGAAVAVDAVAPEQRKRLIELITRVRPWVEGRTVAHAAPVAAAQPVPTGPPPVPVSVPLTQPPAAVKKEEPVTRPLTMVGQIDSILQDRIEATPLASRGIKLEESPGGGVTVVVGINRYTGVGDVPDPDVQAAIRGAIAEWERKFTPGL